MVSNTDQCVYAHPESPHASPSQTHTFHAIFTTTTTTNSIIITWTHDQRRNPSTQTQPTTTTYQAASERQAKERKQKTAKNQGLYMSRNCELCGTRSGPAAQDSRLIARYSRIGSLALLSLVVALPLLFLLGLVVPSSIAPLLLVLLCARASNRPLAIETRCAVIWL